MAHPQVTFRNTTFTGNSILVSRRNTVASTTLKAQLEQFKTTGRYTCFELKWHPTYDDHSMWPVPKHLFWDSDLAKWIEGACYFLESHYDEEIDDAVRYIVKTIRSAQQEDGYLNLHYTVVDPKGRWSNIRDMHELYNCGHLIEAALAHRNYYKNNDLLEPLIKYVSLISNVFGPENDKLHAYPGHPEIEMALLRLYVETGNEDAYRLTRYFVEERGNSTGQDGKLYYDWEAEKRQESPWKRPSHYPEAGAHWYNQAHAPILEQQTIEGHSVRALYLLTAVADLLCMEKRGLAPMNKSSEWLATLHRLWDNMVDKKMYVTGGIGAIKQWEGFGIDYFLPQSTDEGGCYSETCASIAIMFLAERLLAIDLDGRYGDVMELCLYNNVMTAMSLDGKSFTYVNQLGSSEADKSGREDWFWCACCPPNYSRLFGSLGGYLWHYGEDQGETYINVHLYTSARVVFQTTHGTVELEQQSHWPWDGTVSFTLQQPKDTRTTVRLRIPAWTNSTFTLDPPLPEKPKYNPISKGYLTLSPDYVAANPNFTLKLMGFTPRWLEPHPYTSQNTVFLARGPIIYCAEDAQNPWETNHFKDVAVKPGQAAVREESRVWEPTGESYITLHTKAWTRSLRAWKDGQLGTGPVREGGEVELVDERDIVFVPYYFRANSGGKGHMRVGLIKG
ncbi:glycoside hydrolase family 127 protein [Stemphylium lycopersici]|uniref:Glycoside hydrolase family 127 protein n=1 Tax=Stemphylium lycopersici TaxID=183478 RepID=A0A364N320_STELY|nr:glycoside hydrolase family 127 protein [Stemphylium lycopersici]RAR01338.1 glycoside hydrolase family 127 protein [Stemphylium lycopersici]RAR09972.1 glycoside hydrolase family 127 protein [Stemphylium lycopersici]